MDFVTSLDEATFGLSEMGFLGRRNQREAALVAESTYRVERNRGSKSLCGMGPMNCSATQKVLNNAYLFGPVMFSERRSSSGILSSEDHAQRLTESPCPRSRFVVAETELASAESTAKDGQGQDIFANRQKPTIPSIASDAL